MENLHPDLHPDPRPITHIMDMKATATGIFPLQERLHRKGEEGEEEDRPPRSSRYATPIDLCESVGTQTLLEKDSRIRTSRPSRGPSFL